MALKRDPWVTIQKRGTLSLNRAAYVMLGSPGAVELLYDTEDQIVGLRECDPRDRDAVHFRSPTGKDSGPIVLSAMAYLRFHEISVSVHAVGLPTWRMGCCASISRTPQSPGH